MYILRKELEMPLEELQEVNRKDHTTVIHAFELRKNTEDNRFSEKIQSCLKILRD